MVGALWGLVGRAEWCHPLSHFCVAGAFASRVLFSDYLSVWSRRATMVDQNYQPRGRAPRGRALLLAKETAQEDWKHTAPFPGQNNRPRLTCLGYLGPRRA